MLSGNNARVMELAYMKYTRERLEEAVNNSTSMAGVLRYLGLHQSGGNHSHISRRVREFELDTSHFLGKHQGLRGGTNKRHHTDVLVVREANSPRQDAFRLRRCMIESGIPYECRECGIGPEWNGRKLTLEVDHINEVPWDDRPENLQFLCPNCHAQKTHNHE